ncbi:unnamed protein product [Macrosiphum euphorbiae]|uniref:Uncharacterized protein n=1 Tax=Macrosiphum euphorbiae TaxID=13131 RepID=A0AAV0W326_9HEMI|nr:unnamed protein product [Macrosiphum euphorbiae]
MSSVARPVVGRTLANVERDTLVVKITAETYSPTSPLDASEQPVATQLSVVSIHLSIVVSCSGASCCDGCGCGGSWRAGGCIRNGLVRPKRHGTDFTVPLSRVALVLSMALQTLAETSPVKPGSNRA